MRFPFRQRRRASFAALCVALAAVMLPGGAQTRAQAATATAVLNEDAILAPQGLDEPQWYKDNIPFLDTPDANFNGVYLISLEHLQAGAALRYTTPGTGYISTEYCQPVWYSNNAS